MLIKPDLQGSTWLYQSYIEPFFRANEQELDQGILSAQSTAITFVQTKFQAVWEAISGATDKNPTNGRPGAGAQGPQRPGVSSPHQSYQGQPGTAPGPYDTARQLFNTYAPDVLGSLVNRAYGTAPADPNPNTRSPARPSPRPNASSSSTSLGNGSTPPYQRTSATPRSDSDAPSFPQPRFH
jgi:receptor expression-enhancing protein 1/2/3/4